MLVFLQLLDDDAHPNVFHHSSSLKLYLGDRFMHRSRSDVFFGDVNSHMGVFLSIMFFESSRRVDRGENKSRGVLIGKC